MQKHAHQHREAAIRLCDRVRSVCRRGSGSSALYDDQGRLSSILSLAEDVTAGMDAEE